MPFAATGGLAASDRTSPAPTRARMADEHVVDGEPPVATARSGRRAIASCSAPLHGDAGQRGRRASRKAVAAHLEIAELIERGAGGRQQHDGLAPPRERWHRRRPPRWRRRASRTARERRGRRAGGETLRSPRRSDRPCTRSWKARRQRWRCRPLSACRRGSSRCRREARPAPWRSQSALVALLSLTNSVRPDARHLLHAMGEAGKGAKPVAMSARSRPRERRRAALAAQRSGIVRAAQRSDAGEIQASVARRPGSPRSRCRLDADIAVGDRMADAMRITRIGSGAACRRSRGSSRRRRR